MHLALHACLAAATIGLTGSAWGQTAPAQIVAPPGARVAMQAPPPSSKPAATAAPSVDKLSLHFDTGSTAIRPQDVALLDQAARLYRDASPVVMIVAGATDSVGSAEVNLGISEARARVVLQGLVSRGIPAERFQLLAKGKTDPVVATAEGVAEPENRVVEIRWR